MARQRIDFEQGGPVTGDSGERGNSTEGQESIKPNIDGESAVALNFNRPGENVRQRTERLRDAGEDGMYLQDSDMRWAITAGRADGFALAPTEPYPGIVNWNPATGIFETTENLVVQPLNTPKEDVQETKDWTFTGAPDGVVSIKPLLDTVDAYKSKRAYNHANLLKVVWLEADPGDLAGAVVPSYCDVTVDGDPEHILTVTIRDDGQTQVTHVKTALDTVDVALLVPAGIQYSVTGTLSILIDYTTDVDPKEYQFAGTFERELHYIQPAAFSSFFASNALADGDTLAVWFDELTDDGTNDPPTGRRQAVPSNSNTTVTAGMLFKTSDYPERIPLAIPLCKRVGDELFWLDGTVVMGAMSGEVLFGEHGYTVNRILNWASTVALNAYSTGAPLSADPFSISAAPLQTNLETMTDFLNKKGSLDTEEMVTGNWIFDGYVRIQDSAVSIASGDYSALDITETVTIGDASNNATGIDLSFTLNNATGSGFFGGINAAVVVEDGTTPGVLGAGVGVDLNGGTFTDVWGVSIVVDAAVGVTAISGDVFGMKLIVDSDVSVGGTAYGIYLDDQTNVDYAFYQAGTAQNYFQGNTAIGTATPSVRISLNIENDTVDLSGLIGTYKGIENTQIITIGNSARDAKGIESRLALTSTADADDLTGASIEVGIEGTGTVDEVRGFQISAVTLAASTVDEIWGADVDVVINAASSVTSVYGLDLNVNAGASGSNSVVGMKVAVTHSGGWPNGGDRAGFWLDCSAALDLDYAIRQQGTSSNWFEADDNVFEGQMTVGEGTAPDIDLRIGTTSEGVNSGGFATGRKNWVDPGGTTSVSNVGILSLSGTASGAITDLTNAVEGQWVSVVNGTLGTVTLNGSGFGTGSTTVNQGYGALVVYFNSLWWVVAANS